MKKIKKRRAFTIVELVIVIAVIAILATVLVPTFGNAISNAKDSAAMQEARNAYTDYVVEQASNGELAEFMVYEADGKFVALHSGAAVGVYATRDEALESMVDTVDTTKIFDTGDGKLFAYGVGEDSGNDDTPTEPAQPLTYTFAEKYGTTNWLVGKSYGATDFVADLRYFTNNETIEVKAGTIINNPDPDKYYFAYIFFDAAGNSIGSMVHAPTGTAFESVEIEEDTYIRICIKFMDDTAMTDALKDDILDKFTIQTSDTPQANKLKCSFLGDSITEGINTTKTYHDYLVELCNIEAKNFGANGSHISTYILEESKHSYCMVERVETVDKDSDLVFVFGGTNDFNRGCPMGTFDSKDKNTFKGALSVMLQYLKDNFPDKKVYLMTPIRRGVFADQLTDLQKNAQGLFLTDYVNAIKEAGELFNIEVIDLYTLTGLNPNEKECADKYFHNSGSIDNLHPNADGHLVIAQTIKEYLNW